MAVHYDRYMLVGKNATNPGTQFEREAVRWKFIKKCGMLNLIKDHGYIKGNNLGFAMKFKGPVPVVPNKGEKVLFVRSWSWSCSFGLGLGLASIKTVLVLVLHFCKTKTARPRPILLITNFEHDIEADIEKKNAGSRSKNNSEKYCQNCVICF